MNWAGGTGILILALFVPQIPRVFHSRGAVAGAYKPYVGTRRNDQVEECNDYSKAGVSPLCDTCQN